MPKLILLDNMMPIMNGHEFRVSQLQNSKIAQIPTILFSATDNVDNFEKLNFTEYIKKPIELETLLNTVKKYF